MPKTHIRVDLGTLLPWLMSGSTQRASKIADQDDKAVII